MAAVRRFRKVRGFIILVALLGALIYWNPFALSPVPAVGQARISSIKVGWIGSITGPAAKYGAFNAALLARDEINASDGVAGRRLEIIFEDGKCDGKSAATAAKKLIDIDRVQYILGGHCTPESMAIAPIATQQKVVALAAITSSPKLSHFSDYFFRITPISTAEGELLAKYAVNARALKHFAVLFEETDYAAPQAESFIDTVKTLGGDISLSSSFNPGETDFRTILSRAKVAGIDALYVGTQSPDAAKLIYKQKEEINFLISVLANDVAGNTALSIKADSLKGLVFADLEFDIDRPEARHFVSAYISRYGKESLVHAPQAAEAYDIVKIFASQIEKCGESSEDLRQCLSNLDSFPGAAGTISINSNHDGVRGWSLKRVDGERAEVL